MVFEKGKSKFEYYGLILDEKSHNELVGKTKHLTSDGWKLFAHHMTILHSSRPDSALQDWAELNLGKSFELKVTHIGVDDKVIAVKCETVVPSANLIKHITVATSPTGKPVHSNNLKEWLIVEPFILTGDVRRV